MRRLQSDTATVGKKKRYAGHAPGAILFPLTQDWSPQSKEEIFEIEVKLSIEMWLQAYAKQGIYNFIRALVYSQIFGFCFIKFAQFSRSDLLPSQQQGAVSRVSDSWPSTRTNGWCLIFVLCSG